MPATILQVSMLVLGLLAAGPGADPGRPELPNHAVVLIYHHVARDTPAATSVSPEIFAGHLEALAEGGHQVLALGAIVDSLRHGRPLPDLTVGLSFDDGFVSVHETAFPLLRERGWPFAVFVCPSTIDASTIDASAVDASAVAAAQGGLMTWDQLREMADHGATIANHGLHHRHLQRRQGGESDAAWRARVRGELLAAQARIVAEIGQAPPLVAYPYGEYDTDLLDLVAELGWAGFGQQSGACGETSDFTVLPRFPMAGEFAAAGTFGDKVRSLPLPVQEVRPGSPLIAWPGDAASLRPVLELRLSPDRPWHLAAFVSGQGPAAVAAPDPSGSWHRIRAGAALPPGRSRYNVTAPTGIEGRFHWYSHVWIVGDDHRN